MRQAGLFGLSDHLKRLSAVGDPLETMERVVDFEAFRPVLDAALGYADGSKAGRPPYDPVTMLKVLILAAQNTVSDVRMEFLIRDRLSWLRFLGFDLGASTPDSNTIRLFRERLTQAGALDALFADFDHRLRTRGYLPMGGQIVDATLVAAPKQRNTAAEKAAIKEGKSAVEIWPGDPTKAAQKDTDARWTLKFAKARALPDGRPGIDIAIPSFGYKSSIAICRRYGFVRCGKVTDGARFDGQFLEFSEQDLDTIIALQFKGSFFFLQAMVAAMDKGGSIIQIISAVAQRSTTVDRGFAPIWVPRPTLITWYAPWPTSSAGAASGSTPSPRATPTRPCITAILLATFPDWMKAAFADATPLGRYGTSEDISAAAVWLAVAGAVICPTSGD